LLIVAREDDRALDIHDIAKFFQHLLKRVDWNRDLHFQTRTTIDTLDYTGNGLNAGSKLVIAAAGEPKRTLNTEISADFYLPAGFSAPHVCMPGVLAVTGPPHNGRPHENDGQVDRFCTELSASNNASLAGWPLIVIVDNSRFCAESLSNFLWMTFTRSNPADDIYGVGSYTESKHWGCRSSLVIDARIKPHMAPPLDTDPEVTRKVDALGAPGGPLHGVI
jgi:4-hydroxy-3-polyprenylbenzoate decarboxylase